MRERAHLFCVINRPRPNIYINGGGRALPPRTPKCSIISDILPVLPPSLRNAISNLPDNVLDDTHEIRLRKGRPVMLMLSGKDMFLGGESRLFTDDEATKTLQLMSGGSIYALEDELRNGYLTLKGGHRVGLVGRAVLDGGKVRTLKSVSGFNIRVAREIRGAAGKVMPYCISDHDGSFLNTLVISPPRCGKTTLLRDMVRQASDGIPGLNFPGIKVGLVDERSEVAACYSGTPQNDVGIRTDVLDACPKAEGIMMLIRSMAPNLIATDEIGRTEDVVAIEEATSAGVSILVTVHGATIDDVTRRPALDRLLGSGAFKRLIFLGTTLGPGTLECIVNVDTRTVMLKGPLR